MGIGAMGIGGVGDLLKDGGEYEGGGSEGGRDGGLLHGETDGDLRFILLAHGFLSRFELLDTNPAKLKATCGDPCVGVMLRGVELRLWA
jgi:hypothetical protein